MQYTPFTLDEANEIAEDFEDLIDTDFRADIGLVYLIDNVMVCPFDEAGKQVFADNYFKTKDKTGSLRFFKGEEFEKRLLEKLNEMKANNSYLIRNTVLFIAKVFIVYKYSF